MEHGDAVWVLIVEHTVLLESTCSRILVIQGLGEIEIDGTFSIRVYRVFDDRYAIGFGKDIHCRLNVLTGLSGLTRLSRRYWVIFAT